MPVGITTNVNCGLGKSKSKGQPGNLVHNRREFGRRLLEKGVEAEHLSLLPPEPEYAQVIDISGYEMTGESARDFTAAAPKEMSADE